MPQSPEHSPTVEQLNRSRRRWRFVALASLVMLAATLTIATRQHQQQTAMIEREQQRAETAQRQFEKARRQAKAELELARRDAEHTDDEEPVPLYEDKYLFPTDQMYRNFDLLQRRTR